MESKYSKYFLKRPANLSRFSVLAVSSVSSLTAAFKAASILKANGKCFSLETYTQTFGSLQYIYKSNSILSVSAGAVFPANPTKKRLLRTTIFGLFSHNFSMCKSVLCIFWRKWSILIAAKNWSGLLRGLHGNDYFEDYRFMWIFATYSSVASRIMANSVRWFCHSWHSCGFSWNFSILAAWLWWLFWKMFTN